MAQRYGGIAAKHEDIEAFADTALQQPAAAKIEALEWTYEFCAKSFSLQTKTRCVPSRPCA